MERTLTLADDDLVKLQNQELIDQMNRQRTRLFQFIRRRVPETEDAEDILQEVFFQLIESARSKKPIEQLTSWLFRVARNKIVDLYRKKKPDSLQKLTAGADDNYSLNIADLLVDQGDNPESMHLRNLVWNELDISLKNLPQEQRSVFIMHELDGMSFKQIAELTGESVNTLLSRKRYAVIYLRRRLKLLYEETFSI